MLRPYELSFQLIPLKKSNSLIFFFTDACVIIHFLVNTV